MTEGGAPRFVKPSAAEWTSVFGRSLVVVYMVSIPLSWFFIQQSGMGVKPDMHLSPANVLFGILMLCVLWAPLTCLYLAPVWLPLTALVAFGIAGVRKAAGRASRPAQDGT